MIIFLHRESNESTGLSGFLSKEVRHKVDGCEVCTHQIEQSNVLATKQRNPGNESGNIQSSPTMPNKIVQRIHFPDDVVHDGFQCADPGCLMFPIKGNAYYCLKCPKYSVCENCGEKGQQHEHPLLFTASKVFSRSSNASFTLFLLKHKYLCTISCF